MKAYDSEPVSTGKDLSSTIAKDEVQEPTAYELDCFYGELSKVGKPAILSLISRFSDNYVPLCKQGVLSMPLTDLFKPEYMALSYPDLLAKCEECFCSIAISCDQSKALRKILVIKLALRHGSSKELAESASRFKAAACTNPAQPSQSLFKAICYPDNQKFYTKQMYWECVHEKTAFRAYISQQETEHTQFHLDPVDLLCIFLTHSWELLQMVQSVVSVVVLVLLK